jgi:dTDP-4-dehydrorhamnose reductase
MKVLLTGPTGQVGSALRAVLDPAIELVPVPRAALDLCRPADVAGLIDTVRPDVLINAAAYTAVDQAESDKDRAFAINATAPGVMALAMKRLGGLLVHYSTDYVFDGTKPAPYVEEDPTRPLSVYGDSKLAGEKAVFDAGGACLIFRTSWIYDLQGRNFFTTMRRLAGERPELRVVADQFGAPTSARWVAQATAQVLDACYASDSSRARLQSDWRGIYHLTAGGRTSWHGFAQAIVAGLADKGVVPRVPVVPIGTRDYPTPAVRPANSVLSNAKNERVFGVRQVDWSEQLQGYLQGVGADK